MFQTAFDTRLTALPSVKAAPAAPAGSMSEVIVSDGSAIQPHLLLPMLAHCNSHKRWLMWFSPNQSMMTGPFHNQVAFGRVQGPHAQLVLVSRGRRQMQYGGVL